MGQREISRLARRVVMMRCDCDAWTHVGFVKNGNAVAFSCQRSCPTGFVRNLPKYYCVCNNTENAVVNLLLWGAHNFSACILSHNNVIAVWLEYEINMSLSLVFFFSLNNIACLNRPEYKHTQAGMRIETSHYGEYKHPTLLLFHISDKDHGEGERVDSSTVPFFFLPHTPPVSN